MFSHYQLQIKKKKKHPRNDEDDDDKSVAKAANDEHLFVGMTGKVDFSRLQIICKRKPQTIQKNDIKIRKISLKCD